jgi:hypothetical protein
MKLALSVLTGPRTRMITTPNMAYNIGCIEYDILAGSRYCEEARVVP